MSAPTARPRRVLLGITGGIAAYKSAIVVRRLVEAGCEVQVVMTPSAEAFITPLTLHSLSGRAVRRSLLDEAAEAAMGHIELARWADVVLVAPASADFLARLCAGMADDLLATACLATERPIVVAPAMNQQMWLAPATRANVEALRARGVRMLGPASGDQACGEVGPGRMLEPEAIVEALLSRGTPAPRALDGRRVVITAGPTREPVDPVRFITNRSSGRMGFAVAQAAREAGADVQLIAGPCALPTPEGVARVDVETAEEMLAAVLARPCEVFVATAAVADYRVAQVADRKLKKAGDGAPMHLELTPNPDILATVSAGTPRPFCVGFAAETHDVEHYAKSKLSAKRLDMIAANDVSRAGQGFDAETNVLDVYWPGGQRAIAHGPKPAVAAELVALIAERFLAQEAEPAATRSAPRP